MEESQTTATKQPQTKMKMPKSKPVLLVGIIVVLLVLIVAIVGIRGSQESTSKAPNKFVIAGKVDITNDAFVPETIKIKKGETVQWTNTTIAPHQVATDPFPTEDGLKDFKQDTALTKSATYDYTFDQAGTYTYHDHLNPTKIKGTVIVE